MFNREKKLLKLNKKLGKVNLKLNSTDESTYQYEKLYTEKVYLLKMIELYQSDKSDKDITVEKALSKEKKKRYLILYGKMVPVIVSICLPLAIYALFNTFYGLIDSIMATNVSQNAVSKISIISQVKNTLSAFGAGVASGGAVLVARFYGAGKMDKARNAASNMLLIEGVLMALTLVLLIPLQVLSTTSLSLSINDFNASPYCLFNFSASSTEISKTTAISLVILLPPKGMVFV